LKFKEATITQDCDGKEVLLTERDAWCIEQCVGGKQEQDVMVISVHSGWMSWLSGKVKTQKFTALLNNQTFITM